MNTKTTLGHIKHKQIQKQLMFKQLAYYQLLFIRKNKTSR